MSWFRKWMNGRYGADQLSVALIGLSIVCTMILSLFRIPLLNLIANIPLLICFLRMLSRNTARRQQENTYFLQWMARIVQKYRTSRYIMKDKKFHIYMKCPQCGQKLRLPRGKGKIHCTCPKCKKEFDKTT